MKPCVMLAAFFLATATSVLDATAQTPPPAPTLVEPASGAALVQPMTLRASLDLAVSGVPATIRRGQVFTATGTVTNAGGSNASGYSVSISVNPANSMRLQNSQTATQSVATVAVGGSQNVSWQIRADRAASATLTMTLRDSSGATVRTARQTITITN